MIKIYALNHPKLRKDKWISQITHSVLNLFVQSCEKQDNILRIKQSNFDYLNSFLFSLIGNKINIEWLDSQDELNKIEKENFGFFAFDHRTEKSCIAVDELKILKKINSKEKFDKETKIKHVFMLRDNKGLSKEQQYTFSVTSLLMNLLSEIEDYDNDYCIINMDKKQNLKNLIEGNFYTECFCFFSNEEFCSTKNIAESKDISVTEIQEGREYVSGSFTTIHNDVFKNITSKLKSY